MDSVPLGLLYSPAKRSCGRDGGQRRKKKRKGSWDSAGRFLHCLTSCLSFGAGVGTPVLEFCHL